MEDGHDSPGGKKWPGRMGLLCLLLFAVFWSLGPFFFWTFLLLGGYFGFLQLYYSRGLQRWFEGMSSSFRGQQQAPSNPYQAFRPGASTSPSSLTPQAKARLIIRIVVIGSFFLMLFLFLVGLFSSVDGTLDTSSDYALEAPAEDNGTTFWNEKGNAALQNEKQDSAIYYYDRALAVDPQNVYALYNKGLVCVLRQDYRKGNALTRRCLQYHPDYNPAWWLLGYSYDLTNQTDSALYSLERAYDQDYRQPDFLQLLAEVNVKKDKRQRALEVYQIVVNLDTTRADIFRKMAELDPSNAEKYMEKVRALGN